MGSPGRGKYNICNGFMDAGRPVYSILDGIQWIHGNGARRGYRSTPRGDQHRIIKNTGLRGRATDRHLTISPSSADSDRKTGYYRSGSSGRGKYNICNGFLDAGRPVYSILDGIQWIH